MMMIMKMFLICLMLKPESNFCGLETRSCVCLIGQSNCVDDISGFPVANQRSASRFCLPSFCVDDDALFCYICHSKQIVSQTFSKSTSISLTVYGIDSTS